MGKGASKAALRALRKKYRLGEFSKSKTSRKPRRARRAVYSPTAPIEQFTMGI